mmetsp:Transcript_854/g.1228  ORF Transcript_854/g.1228 Transcript_854/m.1228 type:complete len:86 (+) Transcript_854:494-751(+)
MQHPISASHARRRELNTIERRNLPKEYSGCHVNATAREKMNWKTPLNPMSHSVRVNNGKKHLRSRECPLQVASPKAKSYNSMFQK